ncbi:MAG TPA: hypothetical protein ENG40_04730 [Thermoprotei archaeon]|nr:hypothetical protein [Thermoprotei archaeon]
MANNYVGKLFLDNSNRLLLSGVPVIIISRKFFAGLQKSIEEIFGVMGTKIAFHRVGYNFGYKFAEKQLRRKNLTSRDIVRALFRLSMQRGWGFFELISLDEEKMEARFRISRSYGEEYGNVGRDVCYIWQGIFMGVLQAIANFHGKNIRIRCNEEKCVGKGDPYCEFLLFPL